MGGELSSEGVLRLLAGTVDVDKLVWAERAKSKGTPFEI